MLALSGYLAERGRMSLVGVIVAATLGGVLGALLLYALGAWFGETRAKMLLAKLPLVDLADMDARLAGSSGTVPRWCSSVGSSR